MQGKKERRESAPWHQAEIQRHPVEQWRERLELVPEDIRDRVRSHLKTVYALRKKGG